MKCLGTHTHVRVGGIEAGQLLSTWAQKYPREMSDLIVRSMVSASDYDDPPTEAGGAAFKRNLTAGSERYEL